MHIGIAILAIMTLGAIWAFFNEKKLWNNGICARYNEPWVHFDNDSQGGRGYKCRDQHIWISWPVDRLRPVVNRSKR
ncbi:MAG: hypothetical protein JSS83_05730 [Cyanobacteria bacterium SZAS LIN-3]|nr:hypothetical protein [Cyanobacteria bacterium SZAS LIN-3]MBS2010910.1 hypothetical protein [Cyanobacteria bacterium SZAS TMP-1]